MGFDVVGVGHAAIDTLSVVGQYPSVDTKVEVEQFSIQGGGPVATALVTLSRLGRSTAFVGKLSDDNYGDFLRVGLEEEGVDLSGLVIQPDRVSPYSFIAVERRTGKRTIFWTRGDLDPLLPEQIDADLISSARLLHVDGLQMRAQLAAARMARQAGVPVVYDAGSPREGAKELMSLTDLLIASEHFAAEMGGGDLEASLERLSGYGPSCVVLTLGEEGSIGTEDGQVVRVPALDVAVVDTTGAGDVYHGAFIHATLEEQSLLERMRFAAVSAGLKCRALGGRAGIPELEEIQAHLLDFS